MKKKSKTERTFAIIKPDAVRKKLVNLVLTRAAASDLYPVRMAMDDPPRTFWEEFYEEHRGQPFYEELVDFMHSGPSVFIVFEGPDAITAWRDILGATNPKKAAPGTLRNAYGEGGPANVAHGSDSLESARREVQVFQKMRIQSALQQASFMLAGGHYCPIDELELLED